MSAEVAPGWYPDPYGHAELRYHDGNVWTDSVAATAVDPVEAPTDEPPSGESTTGEVAGRRGRNVWIAAGTAVVFVVGVTVVAIAASRSSENGSAVALSRRTTTTADLGALQAEYEAEVQRTCSVISANISLQTSDVFRFDERFEELPRYTPYLDVSECTQPARASASSTTTTTTTTTTTAPTTTAPTTTAPTTTAPPPAPTTTSPRPAPAAPSGTLGQQNALRAAQKYLDYTAFSRSGLIKQLEYEGYSTADATYAVDTVTVDWNEQAAKKAADYLDYTAFSRSGLYDQLIYEGFTAAQAEYGVSTTGL